MAREDYDTFMSLSTSAFRGGTLVDQIDDAHVGDAGIRFQANLAGAAVGVAHFDMVGLYLRTKLAQAVFVQLREGEATVAGKATTANSLW